MKKFPDKPIGSVIEEEVDSEGITLRWWPPAAGFIHYAVAAWYALVFCIWVVGCFTAGVAILFQPAGFFSCCTIVVLCVLTYAGARLAYTLWALLAPDRPASIRLEAEWLRYDPGRSKVNVFRQLFAKRSPKGDPPPLPRPLAARWSEIRRLVLDREGKQGLSIDYGSDRIEIGAGLCESEQEWLFWVLQRWHTPNESVHGSDSRLR
jgi:hypothetical protein